MLYVAQLTIPAKTLIDDPIEETVKVTLGKVNEISVQFPPGCCNLVGIWVEFHGVKILPYNPTGILYGDSSTLVYKLDYDVDTLPYDVLIKGYNQDDIYNHNVYLTINVIGTIVERSAVLS